MDQNSFDDLLKVQRMMASKILDESSMDYKIRLYDMIREMTTSKNKTIQVEQIIVEASTEGFSESETLTMLDELERDGLLKYTSQGTIILT